MPMTGSMNARSRRLFPALLLTAIAGGLTITGLSAAEPKDDWRCAQAADTGRWSCARDGVSADASLESATPDTAAISATSATSATSTPLPDIQSEAITPAASNSGEPLDSQSGTPIESVAADAIAPAETPPMDEAPTAPEAPVAIAPAQIESPSTVEPEVVAVPVDEVPATETPVSETPVSETPVSETPVTEIQATETPADLGTTTDPEPAPAAAAADPNAPAFQRLAYVPDKPTSLLELPGEFWVAQIMAVSSKEFLEAYAEEYNLRGLSAARIASGERLFFVLILGIYETKDRAQQAITNLPPPYNRYQKTILLRTLASLQQAMRKADKMTGTADF